MEKEVSEIERRLSLKKVYSEKIKTLLSAEITDEELFGLIRKFFSEFLKLEYEFTYEELSQELNKVFIKPVLKNRIDHMLDDLSWLEYTSEQILDQEKRKKILGELNSVIDELISEVQTKNEKISFFHKLFRKKKESTPPAPDVILDPNEIAQTNDMAKSNVVFNKLSAATESHPEEVIQKNKELLKQMRFKKIPEEEPVPNYLSEDFARKMNASGNVILFNDDSQKDSPKQKPIKKKELPEKDLKEVFPKELLSNNEVKIDPKIDLPELLPEDIFPKDDLLTGKLEENLIIEDNDPIIVNIKKIIEESYSLLNFGNKELAKIKYMNAIDSYNKFSYEQKNKIYLELYDLYLKLI